MNDHLNSKVIKKMIAFDEGDPKRIQHFLKVYEFAHTIGTLEGLNEETQRILDVASILHDIGIHPAEEKYGSCEGKLQEQEGPAYARDLICSNPEIAAELTVAQVDRICYLIGHHHTYDQVDGPDYQILLEADFLVNAYEDDLSKEAILHFRKQVFRTKAGSGLLNLMFGL